MNAYRLFKRFIGTALAVGLLAAASNALACPICMGLRAEPPIAKRIADSEQTVLAQRTPGPLEGQFRVVSVIKGPGGVGKVISAPELAQQELRAPTALEALVLVRESDTQRWSFVGMSRIADAPLLREFAVLKSFDERNGDEPPARLVYFAAKLEDRRPIVAQAAYEELRQAPYVALRTLRPFLDSKQLRRWLADPTSSQRHSLYWLLLGLAGDVSDAELIERLIDDAQRNHVSTTANLSALIAADLELRGDSRVGLVERAYIDDRTRTGDEIAAALLALSVHGNAPGAISRDRVIAAYRLLIRERPPLAGYVAQDLATWRYWDAVPEYTALLESDTLHYSSRVAIASYLRASPNGKSIAIAEPAASAAPNINVVPQ